MDGFTVFVYIDLWAKCAVVGLYNLNDVGRLNVAYPYQGAMREPDFRDKHREKLSPTSFLYPYLFGCF